MQDLTPSEEIIAAIADALLERSKYHLEKGQYCAALECAMARLHIEKGDYDKAIYYADEYWGSLERLGSDE